MNIEVNICNHINSDCFIKTAVDNTTRL